MPTHDHELDIGSTVRKLTLIRDDQGSAMYQVIEDVPKYRNPLLFTQKDWISGHGQHDSQRNDMYFEGQSIDTTQEGRVFLGPLLQEQLQDDESTPIAAPVIYCWHPGALSGSGALFCATSGNLYRLDTDNSTDGWDEVATANLSGITDLKVFNGYLFVARGHGTAYSYSEGGDTFLVAGTSDDRAVKFFVSPNAAGTAEVLWKFDTPNQLKNNSNGTGSSTQWSSAAYIGDTANDITNIFLSNDNLLVGKADGLWHYDSDGGLHQLRPDLKENRSTDNFKYVTDWQVGIYHSEIEGMGEITSYNAYEPMGPLQNLDDIGKRGTIVGLAADKDWIYVAIKDDATSPLYYIYKGREVRKDGVLRWQWCPWIYLGTNATATLAVVQHSTSVRRLWFGYGAASYYVILSDNPTDDSTYRFCESGYLRMSYDYGSNSKWDKLWQSAVLEVSGGNDGETVQVQYRKDTDSAQECIAAATTNGIFETNFSSELSCNKIQFEIHLASNTDTTTPEVSYFQAKGVEKPTTVRIHECVYAIGDEPSKRAETVRTFLRGGRTSTELIKFADLRYGDKTGDTSYTWVVMMPGFPQEIEVLHEKGRQPELGIKCRFQEVSFTVS